MVVTGGAARRAAGARSKRVREWGLSTAPFFFLCLLLSPRERGTATPKQKERGFNNERSGRVVVVKCWRWERGDERHGQKGFSARRLSQEAASRNERASSRRRRRRRGVKSPSAAAATMLRHNTRTGELPQRATTTTRDKRHHHQAQNAHTKGARPPSPRPSKKGPLPPRKLFPRASRAPSRPLSPPRGARARVRRTKHAQRQSKRETSDNRDQPLS